MGALAITTLAGSRLLLVGRGLARACGGSPPSWRASPSSSGPRPPGGSRSCSLLGFWRHVLQRVPIVYDPQYWSLVFPLGMYAVATFMLEKATGITLLAVIPSLVRVPGAPGLAAHLRGHAARARPSAACGGVDEIGVRRHGGGASWLGHER